MWTRESFKLLYMINGLGRRGLGVLGGLALVDGDGPDLHEL